MKLEASEADISQHRQLIQRITESRHFNRSPRQSGFLQYLCNNVLEHPGRELHEQEIGVELFRRDAGYDTNLDNIVRVNASELRKRLALYFENEGASESIILEIPKGGYIPQFVPRAVPEPVPLAAAPSPEPAPKENVRSAFWVYLLAGVCLVLLVSTVWLAFQNREMRSHRAFHTPALGLLWSRILPENGTADLVVADSSLSLLQDIRPRSVSLQHYLSHDYVSQMQEAGRPLGKEAEVNWLTSRRYTSLADVDLVATILRASGGDGFTVNFARDYSADRFRSANAVFIGSKRSNPWVEVFEDQMNFRIDYDEASAEPIIRNRQPMAGEPAAYHLADHSIDTPDAFSIVAFLPNQDRTGNVLIIAGSGMQGTRAAGDLVTSEVEFSRLLDRFGRPWPAKLRHFEVLLKTRIMGGSVRGLEIVSQRLYE